MGVRTLCPSCAGSGHLAVDRAAVELAKDRSGTALVRQRCPTCDEEGWLEDVGALD
ncbi:hypothetical protein [Actinopolymorpha alba]|uniref:hypothetical protein n=1 Tax=Actinopolymorpha alba TaxID=533267 RepID=UPI000377C80E|nr:hypothetical protein [Actinopolymorpha alba]